MFILEKQASEQNYTSWSLPLQRCYLKEAGNTDMNYTVIIYFDYSTQGRLGEQDIVYSWEDRGEIWSCCSDTWQSVIRTVLCCLREED